MNILHNANIFSFDNTQATALVINNGYIVALGSDAELLDGFAHLGKSINLEGKTLWPGLTDSHIHLQLMASSLSMVKCDTNTLEECLQQVKNASTQLQPGTWLRGHGWNQNRWETGFGTARMLDSVCKEHPIYLTAKSLHAAWANSKALALAGIDAQTPDPDNGIIQRDPSGQPTGILFEAGAMAMVESVIPEPTEEDVKKMICTLIPLLWESGLVGAHDFDGSDCWKALLSLNQDEHFPFRIRKSIPLDQLDSFINAGLRTDFGDDWLHLGSVKLFADGALGPQTAAMHSPYEGTKNSGTLLLTEDEIVSIGKKAVSHGIALSIHAIGDRANYVVINALERVRKYEQLNGLPHYQHRIEHVQIIDPQDIERMAKLDIIASVQPVHAPSDMHMAEKYLGPRVHNAYAYRSILETGTKMILGSDAPVESANPFHGIHAAVTRCRLDSSPEPNGWGSEQRISLSQALAGFSSTPLQIANRGTRLGKIRSGYKADLIILNEDPCTINPKYLGEIRPLATIIEGKCMYQAPSLSIDLNFS